LLESCWGIFSLLGFLSSLSWSNEFGSSFIAAPLGDLVSLAVSRTGLRGGEGCCSWEKEVPMLGWMDDSNAMSREMGWRKI
jgi:hypothetical protein